MADYSEAQIWSAIHRKEYSLLPAHKVTGEVVGNMIEDLFPGINYYSLTGLNQVFNDYLQPALSKLFPDIVKETDVQVNLDRKVTLKPLLPCSGYEHLSNPQWKENLEATLAKI